MCGDTLRENICLKDWGVIPDDEEEVVNGQEVVNCQE
jgi:hypothetical protein